MRRQMRLIYSHQALLNRQLPVLTALCTGWCIALLMFPVAAAMAGGSPLDRTAALSLPCVPEWAIHQDALLVESGSHATPTASTGGCQDLKSFYIAEDFAAVYYDSVREVTGIFVGDYGGNRILRHDVDAALNHTMTPLTAPYGGPWLAVDLDLDGNIELVIQDGDEGIGGNGYLDIRSAPDWRLRRRFVLPGMKVYMNPVAVNVDTDPYLEIFFTPHDLGGNARAMLIKYNPGTDSFAVVSDVPAPTYTGGPPAAGDFDNDGRIEFISGNQAGYGLFECRNDSLVYVRQVGEPYGGYYAAAVRPKPGGVLHALLGHGSSGYLYQLLEPTGDNSFTVVHIFQGGAGWSGVHPCLGVDVDCDGLDELVMGIPPLSAEVWEWDVGAGSFDLGCTWDDATYGTFVRFFPVDMDQDLIKEWGTINHNELFRSFMERCVACMAAPSDLISWWPLDEQSGDTPRDVWGGNDGNYVGGATPVQGMVAGGLAGNGIGSFVRVPVSTAFNLGTGDLSVDAWIKTTDASMTNPILSEYDQLALRGWVFWIDQGNALGMRLADGDSTAWISPRVGTFADGAWHHVAVTVNRPETSGVKFYLDGNRIGVGNPTNRSGSITNAAEVRIGGGYSSAGAPVFFNGVLDEVRLFRKALSFREVRSVVAADSLGNCKPASVVCNCNQQGDVVADSVPDVFDVVGLIDYAFSGGTEPPKDPPCPHVDRGDINCDGVDDVFDVVNLIDYTFSGGKAPCNPCVCNPYPTNCL